MKCMKQISKKIKILGSKFDIRAERFAFRHPYLAFFVMFYGVPAFVFAAVCACTSAIVLPAAWVAGML